MDLFEVQSKSKVRDEPSDVVSEFNLNPTSAKSKLNAAKLVDALDNVKNIGELKKQLTAAEKANSTLDVPLHRQAQNKIERAVAYDEAKKKVGFWDEVVRQNRLADKLVFPLKKYDAEESLEQEESAQQSLFEPRTELEIETAKLLQSSKNNLRPNEEFTEAEQEALKAMSIEEAERRKSQLCKMRALISYKTAENKRKNAIKSRRYHKLGKKQKRKEVEKEVLELLRKNDPRAAREKLKFLEHDRIAERATLKHRSTGKWAQQIRILARKDPQLRQALQGQLKLGRDLAQKVFAENDAQESSDGEQDITEIDLLSSAGQTNGTGDSSKRAVHKSSVKIDLTPKIAQIVSNGDGAGGNLDQDMLISEAFADDDVMEEELEREVDDKKEDNLDSHVAAEQMPGWNSWVGPGLLETKRKKLKKRLARLETKKVAESKRKIKKAVIFRSEQADQSIEKFQVKQLPYPYNKVEAFEEDFSHPLGKEWNSRTSYSMLIEPNIKTKMGHVIEPMSIDNVEVQVTATEELYGDKERNRSERRRKRNKIDEDGNIKL